MYFIKRIFYIIIVIILLFPEHGYSAIIKGKVTDASGNGLSYATIFLEGTTIGTTSNGKGDYELSVSAGLYKVVCQFISYKQSSFNLSIKQDEVITHDFVLQHQSLEMKEVTVHSNAEDPAYKIIRHAIKRRKYHLEQVKSFQTSIYLKTVGRSRNLPDKFMGQKIKTPDLDVDSAGRGVLYLMEEYADYYSEKGKEKTIIHSVHESGNSNGLGFAKLPQVLTFYENNLHIFSSRGSISPISENALFYYNYKYLGQFTEQGHTVNKIQVTQKRAFEPCFNGIIYITDDDWAIHSLELTLVKASGIDLFDTVKVTQLFLPVKDDQWVIKSQLIYLTAKIFAFDITANASALYNNQKINQPIPDSIFKDKFISKYEPTANKKDSVYWKEMRLMPLEKDEVKNFKVQDSLNRRVTTPKYLDSVRHKENKFKPLSLFLSGHTYNGKLYRNSFSVNSLLFSCNYNIVEGINAAPKITYKQWIDSNRQIYYTNIAKYGFSNNHFNDMVRIHFVSYDDNWRGRRWITGIEGGQYIFQYDSKNPVLPIINTASVLFVHQSDLKLYERKEGSAFVGRRYGNGFSWFTKLSYQQRIPIFNTTDFSFYKNGKMNFENNLPYHLQQTTVWEKNNAALINIYVVWKPVTKYIQYPDYKVPESSKFPTFSFKYQKGIPSIFESKSDFDKYNFSISDNVRLRLLGNMSYNLVVGGFINNKYVSVPDLEHPYGNRGIGIASPYLQSFQFMPYYSYSNMSPFYTEGHIEYKMKGFLSNKLPLFRQQRIYLVFGGNILFINKDNIYTELLIGLDNLGWKIARLFRFDFVQSWDNKIGQLSGIRVGISPGNGMSINNSFSDTHSEW